MAMRKQEVHVDSTQQTAIMVRARARVGGGARALRVESRAMASDSTTSAGRAPRAASAARAPASGGDETSASSLATVSDQPAGKTLATSREISTPRTTTSPRRYLERRARKRDEAEGRGGEARERMGSESKRG